MMELTGRSNPMQGGIVMEFKDLPKARRQKIMDAAMEEFAAHDYRGANTETIAAKGGISKGLLFYYFKNKKSLYLTLVRHAGAVVERAMQLEPAPPGTDLFDYLNELAGKKIAVLESMPALVQFSVRVFYDGGAQVSPAINRFLLHYTDELFDKYLSQVDTSRFKPGLTPRKAIDLLMYLMDGWMHSRMMEGRPLDVQEMFREYRGWQDMVRRYVYQEEGEKTDET